MFLNQGDAEYLRYHGMQEFDRAMQHLEERYGVSFQILLSTILYVNEMPICLSFEVCCSSLI
jgi:predicted 3-demethylubiquinone-9 3-methyltransferase (glyoxalase superfamily)